MDNQTKDILMLTVDKVPELPKEDRERILWLLNRLTAEPAEKRDQAGNMFKMLSPAQMNQAIGFMEGLNANTSKAREPLTGELTDEEKGTILQMVAALPPTLKERALAFAQGLIAGRSASQPEQTEKEKEEAQQDG